MYFPYLVKGRCPLLIALASSLSSLGQSFNFSHLSALLSPSSFLICGAPSGSTCRATIQRSIPKRVCVKYYLLLQQFLLFDLPLTSCCSLSLPLAPSWSLSLPPALSRSLPPPLPPSRSLLFPLAPSHSLSLWSLICMMSLAPSHFSSPALLLCLFNHLGDFSCNTIIPLTLLLLLLNLWHSLRFTM